MCAVVKYMFIEISKHWQCRVGSRGGGGGGGGAKGAEAPPPLEVNEMRNIHFGQSTNSHLSETSEK